MLNWSVHLFGRLEFLATLQSFEVGEGFQKTKSLVLTIYRTEVGATGRLNHALGTPILLVDIMDPKVIQEVFGYPLAEVN